MENLDAATLAQQAIKLRLITEAQFQECRDGVNLAGVPDPLVRALERKGYLTSLQSQKLLQGDLYGYFLGGYRLLYKIASGSFGRVFRGDDPRTGTVVAIKVLRQRWSEDARTIQLFEREGRVGQALRHPNIVEILAVNIDRPSKQFFIVMEFVEGGNLRDFLAIRKKLEPPEALRLIEDACSGLTYAYSQGITHRDLKPTNILISSQGSAKLVDFGLAGFLEHFREGTSKMYRTVDYAGLEKATGVASGDVRSDIYFLGCVLYEMLTGKAPLDLTKNLRARMHRDRFDNAPTLVPGEVQAPPGVFHLVNTMMALNPRARYQTPSQLLEAVRETRREVEGSQTTGTPAATERSVFVVEPHPRFQDKFRAYFKKLGYRVFLSADPAIALDRYRQKPFDALVLDAAKTNEASVTVFSRILGEAKSKHRECAGILLLAEEQASWAVKVPSAPGVAVLVGVRNLGSIGDKLKELMPPR
jgi:serine/threonine protein kinase